MAFRNGGYVSLWGVYPQESGKVTNINVSSSVKRRATGKYEQDFTGFVTCIGTANEQIKKYVGMKVDPETRRPIARLRLDEVAVTRTPMPNQEGVDFKNLKYYTNFNVYSFTPTDEIDYSGQTTTQPKQNYDPSIPEDAGDEEELPFS